MAGSTHVPALDGLRGVAIGGVLLFHAGVLPGGFLGVDLFFVLSGFLITGLLLREAEAGRISLVGFWGRRLRRLFPAVAVMLVAVTITVWLLQRLGVAGVDADLVRTTRSDALWSQLDLVNWHLLVQEASYWDAFGQSRVFEHLWSIAVEEQFYVVWPLLTVAVLAGRGRLSAQVRVAFVAASGIVASALAMALLWDPADPTRVYTGTDTRAFSLLLGAAVATVPVRRATRLLPARLLPARLLPARPVLVRALGAGIATSWILTDGVSSGRLFTGGLLVHAAACALLIRLVADSGARVLEVRPLRWLGEISYSLYLWHWPLIVLVTAVTDVDSVAVRFAAVGAAVGVAAVSTRMIEAPIRFRAGWARGRSGAVAFALVSVAMLICWLCLPEPVAPAIDISDL